MKVQLMFNEDGNWHDCHDYIKEDKAPGKKVFSWTLWKYDMGPEMVKPDGSVEVKCRAIGSDGEVQDATIDQMYNVRGIMNNAFDIVKF